jgi:hypothetical protein
MENDLVFFGTNDDDRTPDLNKKLTITTDPEYVIPGCVIVGLGSYGDYHNIVLDRDTALAFAGALRARFA